MKTGGTSWSLELFSFWVLRDFPEGWNFHLSLEHPESYWSFPSGQSSLSRRKLLHRPPGRSLSQWKFTFEGDYVTVFPSFTSVLLFGHNMRGKVLSYYTLQPCSAALSQPQATGSGDIKTMRGHSFIQIFTLLGAGGGFTTVMEHWLTKTSSQVGQGSSHLSF